MEGKEYYRFLLKRYLDGTATAAEEVELFDELRRHEDEDDWEDLVMEQMKDRQDSSAYDELKWEGVISNILKQGKGKGSIIRNIYSPVRMVAAAIILLMLGAIFVWIINKPGKQENEMAVTPPQSNEVDIKPGGDKAILTLADGTRIILDSAANGDLTRQGGVRIIKIGGQLTYDAESDHAAVVYNTISTPRGGQYQLELADGTKVWLNAASSLRFPTAFKGNSRNVELTGEGYFEVAHDPAMPFHVKVNELDVQVIGTHFNINSYEDEPSVKTSLLEGRVLVKNGTNHVFLNPGQQVIAEDGIDKLKVAYDVDMNEVVAWKNGRFLFHSASIESIMRQAARWYDVEVVYQAKINETISGSLPRSEHISQLINILEATGKIDFEISGKQVIIKKGQ